MSEEKLSDEQIDEILRMSAAIQAEHDKVIGPKAVRPRKWRVKRDRRQKIAQSSRDKNRKQKKKKRRKR